jgi:poly-gamma-glutamate synthesis protein (capsule biosynthesis protein)
MKFLNTSAHRTIILYSLLTISLLFFLVSLMLFISQRHSKVHVEYTPVSTLPLKETVRNQTDYVPKTLTVEDIFSSDHSWTATLSAERITTIIATGDVIPARSVNYKTIQKNNFTWAFEKTADILKNADMTIINLEAPLITNCPITNGGMVFCGDVRHVEGFIFAGVDAANLANNHMGNWGPEGVDSTVSILKANNIVPFGHTNPVFYDVNGLRIALLGYNDIGSQVGVAHVDEETFEQDITQAKQQADLVFVSFHWGVEYTHQPNSRQIDIAHRAIDAGADFIIGNHPHWVQPPELYKEKLIVYAHGNFIFDQMWSEETRKGVIGNYTFYDTQMIDAEFIPVVIEDYGQPHLAM